jgi:hypothetical protein
MNNSRLIQARNIDLISYLSQQGFKPQRENDRRAYFNSPFRSENYPSFSVDKTTNKWADWGERDAFGDTIDFVAKYESVTIAQAIDILVENVDLNKHILPEKTEDTTFGVIIEKVEELSFPYLIDYLSSRKISVETAKRFCKQITYCFDSRQWNHFFSIGFSNDCEGWELRNPSSKIGSKPKTTTTIKGKNSDKINIYEGFMDFLSAYEIYGESLLDNDCLVLNSIVFAPFVADYISNYSEINCYLDNDTAGDDTIDLFMSLEANVVDCRGVYQGFKDFNEYLMNQ